MTVTLIILGVLAIAALAVTFGFRHSIRQERLTTDSEPESEPSSGTEGRESASAPEGRDKHRDVVDRSASAAVIVGAKPLDDDLLAELDSEFVDTPDSEPERAPDVAPESAPDVEPVVKARLRDRLGKTRATLSSYLKGIAGRGIDATTWDDLEEALLLADVGLDTTEILLDAVKARVKEFKVTQSDEVVALLRTEIESLLDHTVDRTLHFVAGEHLGQKTAT